MTPEMTFLAALAPVQVAAQGLFPAAGAGNAWTVSTPAPEGRLADRAMPPPGEPPR